jgi:5-methylcytosine-specific restriction endonuclease McrA
VGEVVALKKRQHRRPDPPADLLLGFRPAPELEDWARAVFIRDDGPLHNVEHQHLHDATLGFAWAAEENVKAGMRVLGQAELMPPMAMGKWQRARAIEQMKDWFGCLPDFLVTVDVVSGTFDDASFCALVEHELYHCAQATDAFGYPKFHRDSGDPIWGIRVARRRGIRRRGGPLRHRGDRNDRAGQGRRCEGAGGDGDDRACLRHLRPQAAGMMVQALGRHRGRMMRLWVAQDGRCGLCGEKMPALTTRNKGHRWTVDHVWPRRYGFFNLGSTVLAHGPCNTRKGDRDPTGCELVMLAAANARLNLRLEVKPGHILELAA